MPHPMTGDDSESSLRDDESPSPSIYNRMFWLAFLANLLLCTANTLTFRFAEFIRFLGSTEEITGQIIAAGLVGAFVWRLFMGQAMDRFGVRIVWIVSLFVYLIGGLLMTFSDVVGPILILGRVCYAVGLASMFTVALAYVQSLAPLHRRTEMIASYGAAGFLGLVIGAQVGDLLVRMQLNEEILYPLLFGMTTILGAGHGLLGIAVTQKLTHQRPEKTPAIHHLFLQYFPTRLFTVTLVLGLVVAVTTIFLTRFATERGISGIGLFFTTYAITAFLMRLWNGLWSNFSRHQILAFGMGCHTIGLGLIMTVTNEWLFIPPGLFIGVGHALLFPCIVSLGTGAFPEQYRGTGTTICLSAIDVGSTVTAPLVGWMIDHHGFQPTLLISCVSIGLATVFYTVTTRTLVDVQLPPATVRQRNTNTQPALATAALVRPSRRELRQSPATTKVG